MLDSALALQALKSIDRAQKTLGGTIPARWVADRLGVATTTVMTALGGAVQDGRVSVNRDEAGEEFLVLNH